LRSDSL